MAEHTTQTGWRKTRAASGKPGVTGAVNGMQGLTLIEVLVAVLVLGIGLLGLAALQVTSLRMASAGHERSIATIQAFNMIERMRANRAGLEAGAYDSPGSPSTKSACLSSSGCSPTELAHHGIAEWNDNNADLLRNGNGTACIDSDPDDAKPCDGSGDQYVVTVSWDERESSGDVTHAFRLAYTP